MSADWEVPLNAAYTNEKGDEVVRTGGLKTFCPPIRIIMAKVRLEGRAGDIDVTGRRIVWSACHLFCWDSGGVPPGSIGNANPIRVNRMTYDSGTGPGFDSEYQAGNPPPAPKPLFYPTRGSLTCLCRGSVQYLYPSNPPITFSQWGYPCRAFLPPTKTTTPDINNKKKFTLQLRWS